MPVETLYVGPLSNATDTDPAAAYASWGGVSTPVIVGPEPILSDGSMDTYAQATNQFTIASFARTDTRRDFSKGKLDVLSVDSTGATLNSIRTVMVADGITWDTTNEPNEAIDLYDPTTWDDYWGWLTMWNSAGFVNPINSGDTTFLPGEWGSGFRHPVTGANFSAAEVLDFLASGDAHIRASTSGGQDFSTPGSYSATGRIFEFRVEVDYTLIATVAPPCQLYPRDDHQGVGSGAIWPPPSSQQAGRPGGYY